MRARLRHAAVVSVCLVAVGALVACGDDPAASDDGGADAGGDHAVHTGNGADSSVSGDDGGGAIGDDGGAIGDDGDGATSQNDAADDAGAALIGQLTTLTANCTVASSAKYATDEGEASTIDICKLNGAFFWKADMDIDCDGQTTTECSHTTDPSYQSDTSFHQSDGQPLIAAKLPYVVIPLPSDRFDYGKSNIKAGAVVLVLYGGKMSYGVFGDEGPQGIIGEASYAMAVSLGIDPNPASGGIDKGVTYIAFTGDAAVVSPIEDHQGAVTLGAQLAQDLVKNN